MRNLFAALLCFFCLSLPLSAEETITRFGSDVTVNTDASIDVAESISVISENNQIRHGIFRDFPTRSTDKHGVEVHVDFEVQRVTRDGNPENFIVESINYGKRVKIGDKDVLLNSGIHKYVIKYHANRLLGFFDGYDELYWNVVGNGWPFAIQSADVKIHLPSGAEIKQSAFYTGVRGSDGKDARATASSGNEYAAQTTRVLRPHEDFTVAVAWQKGIVTPPSAGQQQLWLLRDNAGFAGLAITLLSVAGYFFYTWSKVGRDPAGGTIIPLFHPPQNMGPADVRYVWRQNSDNRAVAAALVGLAVKGRLKIEDTDGSYAVNRLANTGPQLVASETALYNALPSGRLEFEQSNHERISSAINAVERSLERDYRGTLFVKNFGWFAIGLLISIVGVILSSLLMPDGVGMVWLMVGGFCTVFWGVVAFAAWGVIRGIFSGHGFFTKLKSLVGFIFLIPFFGAGIAVPATMVFSEQISPALIVFIAATMAIGMLNLVFFFLMPTTTVAGQRIVDAIEGFRLYMTTAEEKRLDMLNPPEKTPELFERYLPYAMALDCENAWNNKFAAVLAAAAVAGASAPLWYSSSSGRGWGGLTEGIGAGLASTLSSSSTAPGSSSGSGGDGSSGGGGGGGGGGGW
jgi:uncharacterized membrane protein YgcG